MAKFFLNRAWQERFFAFLIFLSLPVGGLGIYTLYASPTISFDPEFPFPVSDHHIRKIGDIELPPTFFMRLPEFFTPREEAFWWDMQKRVYQELIENSSLSVELGGKGGVTQGVKATASLMSLTEVIKRIGLVYLVALIYLLTAVSVFQKHRALAGRLLAFFLLAGSLYFLCSAPIVNRGTSLEPFYFKILVAVLYIAAGGLVTLVHFAMVFPRPKKIIQGHPAFSWIFYGYFLLTVILYLTGIIAFGTTFPLFCFFTFAMIGAFIHSLVREEDLFLRKQITVSLLAPLVAGSAFIFLHLLPGILGGMSAMPFTYFALISLILPFALPSAMDNVRLYRERLEAEKNAQQEKERIRQEIHDNVCNDLTNIRFLAELSEQSLSRNPEKVGDLLRTIKETALTNMERIRDFLWAIDMEGETLEDMVSYLKTYTTRHMDPQKIEVEFTPPLLSKTPVLNTSLRFNLFSIYKEAMTNIIKHSQAKKVEVGVSVKESGLEMRIIDNGVGFDSQNNPRHCYGLKGMRKRAEGMGAVFAISSEQGKGTEIRLIIPPKYLI